MKVTRCDKCEHELGKNDIRLYPWATIYPYLNREYCLLCLQEEVDATVRAVMQELASRVRHDYNAQETPRPYR